VIVELGVNFDSYRNTARAPMTMLNSTQTNKLPNCRLRLECLKLLSMLARQEISRLFFATCAYS